MSECNTTSGTNACQRCTTTIDDNLRETTTPVTNDCKQSDVYALEQIVVVNVASSTQIRKSVAKKATHCLHDSCVPFIKV